MTKYETQAHNKEWILSKMAKFILEEMLVLPREKNGEVEEVLAVDAACERDGFERGRDGGEICPQLYRPHPHQIMISIGCDARETTARVGAVPVLASRDISTAAKHLKWGYGARAKSSATKIITNRNNNVSKHASKQQPTQKQHALEKKSRHVLETTQPI